MWALKNRSAVSPVIATVMMVAVTVVLSAVLLVMVMAMMDGSDPTPVAVLDVKASSSDGEYEISVKAITFRIPGDQVKIRVNGDESPNPLSQYSPQNGHDGLSYSWTPAMDTSQLARGLIIELRLTQSMEGSSVKFDFVRTNGALIGSINFHPSSQAPPSIIDMDNATWENGDPAGFPLVFDSSEQSFVTVPRNNVEDPATYLRIEAVVELHSPPSEQIPHAAILNIDGDTGYRLQISSEYFTFGMTHSQYFVRSNGWGDAPYYLYPQADVKYTVWCIADLDSNTMSIWVNNTEGLMVMAGERSDLTDLPDLRIDRDWTIGAWHNDERYFHGKVHSLDIVVR